jgi:hypothetical protein
MENISGMPGFIQKSVQPKTGARQILVLLSNYDPVTARSLLKQYIEPLVKLQESMGPDTQVLFSLHSSMMTRDTLNITQPLQKGPYNGRSFEIDGGDLKGIKYAARIADAARACLSFITGAEQSKSDYATILELTAEYQAGLLITGSDISQVFSKLINVPEALLEKTIIPEAMLKGMEIKSEVERRLLVALEQFTTTPASKRVAFLGELVEKYAGDFVELLNTKTTAPSNSLSV